MGKMLVYKHKDLDLDPTGLQGGKQILEDPWSSLIKQSNRGEMPPVPQEVCLKTIRWKVIDKTPDSGRWLLHKFIHIRLRRRKSVSKPNILLHSYLRSPDSS